MLILFADFGIDSIGVYIGDYRWGGGAVAWQNVHKEIWILKVQGFR